MTSEDIEIYAGHVSALLSSQGVEKATIVGNSMGGWVAMRLVSKDRDLASRIVLEDTAGVGSEDVRHLGESDTPVLIVWGGADEITPVAQAHALHTDLAGSRLEIFDGVGHVPHWEAPDAFNELVGRFVTERRL